MPTIQNGIEGSHSYSPSVNQIMSMVLSLFGVFVAAMVAEYTRQSKRRRRQEKSECGRNNIARSTTYCEYSYESVDELVVVLGSIYNDAQVTKH